MTVWDMTQLVMTIKSLKFNYPGMEILALKSGSWRENNRCRADF